MKITILADLLAGLSTRCARSVRVSSARGGRTRAVGALGLLLGLVSTGYHQSARAQATLNNIAQISAGLRHTCALTNGGGVKCWGSNFDGQLGNGFGNAVRQYRTPVDVSGLGSGISLIAAGGGHNCGLTNGGGVKCWGSNAGGQLGDGSQAPRLTSVDVSGLGSGVIGIAAGDGHACALLTGGGVKCWGGNFGGELGDGSQTARLTPVDVIGLGSEVSAIDAGSRHTCALMASGGVQCWGYNDQGQLGDGSITSRLTAVDVSGLGSGISGISAGGSHTCALTTGGGVKCWGSNSNGRLGDGSQTQRLTPVDVSGLDSGVIGIAAGGDHTCALTTGGGVKCWGNGSRGQLGDGTANSALTAVGVSGLSSGVIGISVGRDHSCALTSGGGVKCWGVNTVGEIGDGGFDARVTPVDVRAGMFGDGFEAPRPTGG